MKHAVDSDDAVGLEEAIARRLAATEMPPAKERGRQRLVSALRNDPNTDERFARAVTIMVKLIPRGLRGSLGIEGHLLGAVAAAHPIEHLLLLEMLEGMVRDGEHLSTSTTSHLLEDQLNRAVRENWCMRRGCTTCGSFQMVELLTGERVAGIRGFHVAFQKMTWARSQNVISDLRQCSPRTSSEAVMWILYML